MPLISDFPALPGFYQLLFLHIEPTSTVMPAVMAWVFPGYMLLGLISTFVFRAVRDALPNNPAAQERILGASFTALALADVTHILWSFVGLPDALKYDFASWNSMTHGNITFVVFLLGMRLAWFMGLGRKRYYYGQPAGSTAGAKKRS
ncbi:hypothetical protein ONZ51_g640 [Trametes cubensis]|uniref:DUF7704 domain-containing protein n=1 Tax=Trametes cubensis TaxID=1111947 RepID=A0AAD7U5B8_9APHY|nr:hypothetical protein ONZ51_g640 [Trametes cubensis]